MRPLVNVDELAVSHALSDTKGDEAERAIGDATLQVVCRACWHEILAAKDKGEVVEMFETICGLLFELQNRAIAMQQDAVIEKKAVRTFPNGTDIVTFRPAVNPHPNVIPLKHPGYEGTSIPCSDKWAIGDTSKPGITLSSSSLSNMGDRWMGAVATGTGNN
jgi:hypothetical protein